MSIKLANVQAEYEKDKKLREEDVHALQQWVSKQPHLPDITELQLILFLHSCYYSIEAAKTTIDTYFTVKNVCPEFLANRDPTSAKLQADMNVGLYTMLPKKTPQNYRVVFCMLMDKNPARYEFYDQVKIFDMSIMQFLMENGPDEGLIILMDMSPISFGHFTKVSVMGMKKFMFYLQEALPVRLKGLHFINVVSFMDKVLALMKPFMKKELLDVLHLHTDSIESLYKYVPKECLPKDYGGNADSMASLHEALKKRLTENADYFKEAEKQSIDESKRPGKPKNEGDIFGVEGSFKKLDID